MSEKEIIKAMQAMCEESLSPITFEKWEEVRSALEAVRIDLE